MCKLVNLGITPVKADDNDHLVVHLTDGADPYDARLEKPATYAPPAGVDVQEGSGEILGVNADRRMALIINDSDTVVYLAVGNDAELHKGIRLNPNGGSVQFGGPGGLPLTTQGISGIHGGTGSKVVTVQEAA